uniref:Uncharacterized protein n=1 Tax=Zea mays TaxID=4577 RepID=A0A804LU26_MAIZE
MPLPIPCTRHPLPPAPAPRGSRACPAVNQPLRLPQNPPPPANPAPRLRNNRRETPVRRRRAGEGAGGDHKPVFATVAVSSPPEQKPFVAAGGLPPAFPELAAYYDRPSDSMPRLHADYSSCSEQVLSPKQLACDRERTPQYMRMSCSSGSPSTPRSLCPCTPALPVAPPIPVSPSSASRRTSPAPVPSPATRGPKIDLFFRQWEERGRRGGLDFLCREGSLGVGIPGVALLRPLLTTDTLERQSCGIRTWRWTRGGASAGIASLRGTGATCALREKEAELEAARARLHVVELEEWL